jgi:hypothetical protein
MGYTVDNNFKLKLIDLTNDDSVASGGGINTQNLRPNQGYIYQIIGIEGNHPDPVGSTAGTHSLAIRRDDGTNFFNIAFISANTGTDIEIQRNGFIGTAETPSNITEQYDLIYKTLFCNYTNYISFRYTNSTDVNQTGTRTLKIWVKEFKEGV